NTWSVVTGAALGTVTVNAAGTFGSGPDANYVVARSFTYKITDADGSVSTATVTLNVTPVDDVPVAKADTFTGSEDTAISGNLSSSEERRVDSGNICPLATGPRHGTVTVKADGTFTYV